MADVGDKVSVRSKAGPRLGVVRAVSGSMLRILWDTGGETSLAPGPGALMIVGKTRGKRPAKAAVAKKKARPSTPTRAKRPKSAARVAAKKAGVKKTARPRPASKASAKKKTAAPAARKAAGKKKASPAKRARKKAR